MVVITPPSTKVRKVYTARFIQSRFVKGVNHRFDDYFKESAINLSVCLLFAPFEVWQYRKETTARRVQMQRAVHSIHKLLNTHQPMLKICADFHRPYA